MGEYEPHDSRQVTLKQQRAPGEPPRTGPREGETRSRQPVQEQADSGQADDAEAEAALREQAIERDADELDAADDSRREGPERFDRND